MTRWLGRSIVIMAGIAVGLVLTSAPAQADSDPLKFGKTVEETVSKVRQTTKSITKQQPTVRPVAQKRVVRQAPPLRLHRVVRAVRPTVRKVTAAPVVRQRIPAPQRKTAVAPVVHKVVKHAPAKIAGHAAAKAVKQLTVPVVTVPPIELATVSLPALELPALHLPAVSLPLITVPPVQLPAVTSPAIVRPGFPVLAKQPTELGATPTGVGTAGVITAAPSVADRSLAAVPSHIAGSLYTTVVEAVQQLSGSVTPTALGTSGAVVFAAAVGLAASGSLGSAASGWAGIALPPATVSNPAVGALRRLGLGLRQTAWRAPYRPAFSPD